jgi:transcriptional regulator with XRE-family HTH domain
MNYYPNFATLLNHYLHQVDDRSASWLARKLELHPSTVNKWLNGNSRPRTPEVIIRIADILHVHDTIERQKLLHAAGYGYQPADHAPINRHTNTDLTTAVSDVASTTAIPPQTSVSAALIQQQQPLLLVSLASGVVLLYLLFTKYLTMRSKARGK